MPSFTRGGEDLFLERVPLQAEDGVVVTLELPHLVRHHSDVKQLDFLVFRARQNVGTIDGIPFCLLNDGCMGPEFKNALSCAVSGVPDTHGKVFAPRNDKRLKWVPVAGDDI